MDAPGDARDFSNGSVHVVRYCRLSGLLVRPLVAAGLHGNTRIGSKSDLRASKRLASCWFSPSRLVDRLPLPVLRPSHIPDVFRRDRNPIRQQPAQERGNSPCSSSAPRRCAPSCWPEPPRRASSACAPAFWPARDPSSRRVGEISRLRIHEGRVAPECPVGLTAVCVWRDRPWRISGQLPDRLPVRCPRAAVRRRG